MSTHNGQDEARNRLRQLARKNGTSLSALSRLIGRNSTYLQQFISKGSPRKLEEQDRRILAEFFGVDEQELGAPGDAGGARIKSPPHLRVSAFGGGGKQDAAGSGRTMGGHDWVDVPRLALGASAGPGALPQAESAYDSFRFSRRWIREMGLEGAQLSAIAVDGDSMEPLLRNGDEILVDCSARSLRDGVHVVRLGEMLMVKRVASAGAGKAALLSENPAYPALEIPLEDLEIVGRVVWKGGKI